MMKRLIGMAVVFGFAACSGDGEHHSGGGAGGASGNAGGGAAAGGMGASNLGGTTNAAGAAAAGAPDTPDGNAGDGSAAGGEGGMAPDVDPDAPAPATPNLTGLIPHSTKWMLVSLSSGLNAPDDIQLLDLETKQLTPANPDKTINVSGGLSPDERTYFFSNGNGAALSERIIHLEPNGFVPAHKLKDYENIPGAYSVLSWSFDARFAMVARGGGGIEVIDMWLEKRVHNEDFSSIVASFAPAGYNFFYDAALTDGYEPRYARVTRNGASPIQKLPPDADRMVFDPSGTRLVYSLGQPLESQHIFVLSLADGTTQELHAAEGEEIANGFGMLPLEDSVLVGVRPGPNGATLTRRVYLDAGKPWQKVSDFEVLYHADDNNLLLTRNFAEKTLELIRVGPYASRKLPLTYVDVNSFPLVGVVGSHVYYVAPDGLHLDSLSDAGELRDLVVSTPGKAVSPCASEHGYYEPKQKFAFVEGDGEALVLVDLTKEPPAIVSTVTAPVGLTVGCPQWGDGDTALAWSTQAADKSTNIYITRWTGAAPETPSLALDKWVAIYALMYR